MFRKIGVILTAGALGILLIGGDAGHPGERQNFTLLDVDSDVATVVASGSIDDLGVEEQFDETIDPATGAFVLNTSFVFDVGTIFITIHGKLSQTVDERTCAGNLVSSADYEITRGTGEYEGARGAGRSEARGSTLVLRSADGTCSQDEADQVYSLFTANLRGDIVLD